MNVTVEPGTGNSSAPCIWYVDAPEHALDLRSIAPHLRAHIIHVFVPDWNDALTPWSATAVFRGSADFGGHAEETLIALEDACLEAERKAGLSPAARGIAGYSLAGLFSLWAWIFRMGAIDACASLSGSLWYEGWNEWLATQKIEGTDRFAYLTLGSKEKRAARAQMKQVESCTERTAEILQAQGATVVYELTPGGHFDHQEQRIRSGLEHLDAWLAGMSKTG